MAQIKLTITPVVEKNGLIDALKTQIQALGKSLSGLNKTAVNKDLTAQLNALAKALNAVARENAQLQKHERDIARIELDRAKSVETYAKAEKQRAGAVKDRAAAIAKLQREETERFKSEAKARTDQLKAQTQYGKEYAKAYNDSVKTTVDANNKAAKVALEQQKINLEAIKINKQKTYAVKDNSKAVKENTQEEEKNKTATEKGTGANKFHSKSLVDMAAQYVQLQLTMKLVYAPLQLIGKAFASLNTTLQTTEDRVIEVKRALGNEVVANETISSDIYDLATRYGQTFDNASDIAVKFARSGMEWRDAIKATEAALLALNVAELNSEEASNGLIAIMAQFRIEATGLEGVIDKLNKTADNFPVTTEKLLTALSRTGSAAVNANLSLEETIGLITALSKATGRSGQNLGTAINSLIQYSSKSSALEIFSSLSDDVAAAVEKMRMGTGTILDVWQKVSEVIKSADERQKGILTSLAESEDIQNLSQELQDELGDIFEKTQDVYGTANTFRKNYFIALLDNIDTVLDAQRVATNALGYSQQENLQYMDTLTAKTTALQTKWESLANDEQGWLEFKKGLADIAMSMLNIVEMTGGLSTAFVGLASVGVMVFGAKIASAIKSMVASLKLAQASAMGVSTVIGGIGLAITIIVQLVNLFKNLAEQEHYATEGMKEYVEAVKQLDDTSRASRSEIEYLDKLIEKYDELNNKAELTVAEKYDLQQVVDTLKTKYASLNFVLDETTGKYNVQTEAIKKNREALLKQIEIDYNQRKAKTAYEKYADELVEKGYLDISQVRARLADTIVGLTRNEQNRESTKKKQGGLTYRQSVDFREEREALVEEQQVLLEIEKLYKEYEKYLNLLTSDGITLDSPTSSSSGGGVDSLKTKYENLAAAIGKAKDELAESLSIQQKQNDVLEAQRALEEAIVKAKRDYINSVLDQYITSLNDALTLEQKQNAVIEARKGLEEAAKKAKLNALLAAINAENKGNETALNIEEKRLAVEKARQELNAAKTQRSIKVYDGNRWVENQRDIKDAEQKLADAVNSLNDYLEQQARDEVVKAIENGNGDTQTIKSILDKWASQGMGSAEWVNRILSLVTQYEDYAPTEEDLATATEKVESAIKSLNDYLKDQAIKEIKTLISENGAAPAQINEILNKWLSKGEGGEIYSWGASIAATIKNAAISGKYDTSAVSSQQSALQRARESLASFYAETMWTEAQNLATNRGSLAQFNDLFSKYRKLGVPEETIELIRDIVYKAGINPSRLGSSAGTGASSKQSNISLYDSGGVLDGMGGIKATNRKEIVLPPNIAEKLLKPTTNAQFERVIKSMGILIDSAERSGGNPEIVPRQSVTNAHYGNNNNYNVNGVTIPAEYAEKHSIKELFDNMSLFRR